MEKYKKKSFINQFSESEEALSSWFRWHKHKTRILIVEWQEKQSLLIILCKLSCSNQINVKCQIKSRNMRNTILRILNISFFVFLKQLRANSTGCLKKLSFTKLSFWRSCFQLGRNTYDNCDKSGDAQFGKTQFF